jgi:hypothetical protein
MSEGYKAAEGETSGGESDLTRELRAMEIIVRALSPLPKADQVRVLRYLRDRFPEPPPLVIDWQKQPPPLVIDWQKQAQLDEMTRNR